MDRKAQIIEELTKIADKIDSFRSVKGRAAAHDRVMGQIEHLRLFKGQEAVGEMFLIRAQQDLDAIEYAFKKKQAQKDREKAAKNKKRWAAF